MKNSKKENLKKTPLYDMHVDLGAKMVPFAGWKMPVKYTSVIEEHKTVREYAGIFDISHMGEFLIEGKDVTNFIQNMVTNDLSLLENRKSQYACMCYPNGTVVDDLIYYRINAEKYKMIVNAGNVSKDFKWLKEHLADWDVEITNQSEKRSRFAFQGPESEKLLQPYVNIDLSNLKRFYFDNILLSKDSSETDVPIFIARTGYTGEIGFEITCDSKFAQDVFQILLDTGAKPIGLGARDSLRLEMSYSLYGHEINEQITPVEASIGWVVKEKKGIDYIGKEILLDQKKNGTERKIVGLNLKERGVMRDGYKIFKDENEIGYITSGGYSPSLEKSIALALLSTDYTDIGTQVHVSIRNRPRTAVVVKTPFYNK